MADAAAARAHDVEERILLAVDVRLQEVERLAARFSLEPQLVAAGGPQDELSLCEALSGMLLFFSGPYGVLLSS